MKTTICFWLLLFCVSCSHEKKYIINGSFKDPQEEQWIYLVKFMDHNPFVDSAKIENGKFKFTGTVDFPEVYGIHYHRNRIKGIFPLFLEPSKLEVIIDVDNWEMGSTVSGGVINDKYNQLEKKRIEDYIKKIWELDERKSTANKEEVADINHRIKKLWEEDTRNQIAFIKTNPESPISIFILSKLFYGLPLEELGSILSGFSSTIKNTSIYQTICGHYNNQMALKNSTPSFLNASEMKRIKIDFAGKPIIQTLASLNPNKVLYIDIWGTWCGPCKEEFSYSRELFQKLDTNKVSFVYLCVDSNESDWSSMIESEILKGQHFLLNKELQKKLANEIGGLKGIPRYLIINKKGEIVNNNAPRPGSGKVERLLSEMSN